MQCTVHTRAAAFRRLATVALLLPPALHAAPWHEPTAAVRFRINPDQTHKPTGRLAEGQTPTTSSVTLSPAGLDTSAVTPVVVTEDGKRIGSRLLWTREAEPIELLFDSSGTPPLFVYLVDGPASLPPVDWEPDAGLILESKAFARAVDSLPVADFVKAWNRTPQSLGRSLVPNIHHAFPTHRPSFENPPQYNADPGPPFWLNRYSGLFHVPPVAKDALGNAKAELKKAKKELADTEVLVASAEETWQKAQAEVEAAGKAPRSANVSLNVLKKRLGSARYKLDELKNGRLAVAKRNVAFWDAAIHELQDGTYTFHAGGETGVHVLVDGQPVVSGTGGKKIRGRRGNFRLPDHGSIRLTPGVHRLECLHFAKGKNTLAMVAWRHPGARHSAIMPPNAFPACGRYVPVAAEHRGAPAPVFSWDIIEDMRCPGANDMVFLRFRVLNPQQDRVYTWNFGDGLAAMGNTVDHLYFRTDTYKVRLAVSASASDPEHSATQTVYAHVLWTKHHLADLEKYEPIVTGTALETIRLGHLANAYTFACQASPDQTSLRAWREHCRQAIVARVAEFRAEQAPLLLRVAAESSDYRLGHIEDARACHEAAAALLPDTSTVRHTALLGLAELLVDAIGDSDGAAKQLASLEKHAAFDGDEELRYALVRADVMLTTGQVGNALDLLRSKTPTVNPRQITPDGVRQRAELRHARQLVDENPKDMVQLEHAFSKVQALVRANPMNHVSPEVNLVALDVYLARGQTRRALLLTDRLLTLNLNDVSRPSVLAKRVRALVALGETEEARQVLDLLRRDYPYSRGCTEAEEAAPAP